MRYDRLGRIIETSDGLDRSRTFAYDEVGNLVARTDPMGSEVRFEYDDRGLLRRRYSTNDTSIDDHYSYDGFGRRTLSRNAHTTLRRSYDALDRLVSVTDPLAGTARFVYDADGRLLQQVFPDGSHGFPAGVSVHYQYDARNLLTSIFDPVAGSWRFEYDAAGRPVRRSDPSGLEQVVSYTPEGFLDTVAVRDGAAGLLQRHRYRGYDALGNPGFIDRNEGGGPDETVGVVYDAQSRVRQVSYANGQSEVFDYDRVGNRVYQLARSGAAMLYELDAADQLVGTSEAATGAALSRFVYDASGRLREKRSGTGSTVLEQYAYDALGRLTSVAGVGAASSADLFYDAEGSRRRYTDSLGAEDYAFAGGVEWHAGSALRRIEAGGLDSALAEVSGTQATGLYPDGAGNVTAAWQAGQPPLRRQYETFGGDLDSAGPSLTRRGYAGLAAEGEGSPLLFMRARHYDTRTGRFLQRDPLGIGADQLYAYAANNPYRFHDPLGLSPVSYSGGGAVPYGSSASYSSSSSAQRFSGASSSGFGLWDSGWASQSGASAGQGVAKFAGVQSAIAGDVRAAQDAAVRALDPFDNAGRSAIKQAARAQTPLLFGDLITSIRPGTDARPGSFGSANLPNTRVSVGGAVLRVGGRAVVGASLVIDAGRIFISSDRARTAVQVGFGTAGAFGGGALGVLGGSAVAPGPGTFIGGVGGAAAGGAAGEALGGAAFDFFFR